MHSSSMRTDRSSGHFWEGASAYLERVSVSCGGGGGVSTYLEEVSPYPRQATSAQTQCVGLLALGRDVFVTSSCGGQQALWGSKSGHIVPLLPLWDQAIWQRMHSRRMRADRGSGHFRGGGSSYLEWGVWLPGGGVWLPGGGVCLPREDNSPSLLRHFILYHTPSISHPVSVWTDRRLWKHYLPHTSYAVGNEIM